MPTRPQGSIPRRHHPGYSPTPIGAKGGRYSSYQHAIANLDGKIRNSIELGEGSRYTYIGPPGYLFFPADQQGWLIYDTGLQPKWHVPIPSGEFPGSIALSPSRTAAALSSDAPGDHTGPYNWQLFAGDPLKKTGEYTGPLPFPGITDAGAVEPTLPGKPKLISFEANLGDRWFFDTHYQLNRRSANGIDTPLPKPPGSFRKAKRRGARKNFRHPSSAISWSTA